LDASGDRVDKAIFSIADVTAETEAKTRLTEARRVAENASRAKSRFLARISHELRTPLNGILGMTEILGDPSDPAEREEAVETIRSCGRELLALVEELLAVADKNPFEGLAEGEPKSPSEILAAVEDRFRVRAETEGKDFSVEDGEFSDGPLLPAQPVFVVLGHLLDNSFKFTGPGDRISLSATRAPAEAEPGTVRFAVRDSGPGIPPSCRETVFNEFFQVDESATRRHGGAGLGLSLARKTAKSLGGSLRLAPLDASTAGTEVWFDVPPAKTRTEGDGRVGDSDRKPALPSESPRILLVEDDPTNRIVATRILEKSGCSVRQARDGEEALEQLYRRSFDLVLMDIRMPKLDGWEVVRRFRADPGKANPPDLPIIALTALAMEKDRAESLAAGMDDYLAKPLTSDALRRKVLAATRTATSSRSP
jgi:CheY-like chemotaxis protein